MVKILKESLSAINALKNFPCLCIQWQMFLLPVHFTSSSQASLGVVEGRLIECLQNHEGMVNSDFYGYYSDAVLFKIFARVIICEDSENPTLSRFRVGPATRFHIHHICYDDLKSPILGDEADEKAPLLGRITAMPTRDLEDAWTGLEFDLHLKQMLLHYISTCHRVIKEGANPQAISFSRSILLHGPPGTGKTSLCKALVQKLACRRNFHFPKVSSLIEMVEINCMSLFSKWFSESGKLISSIFDRIISRASDRIVFVLIDEVESICIARRASIGSNEPSDAIRAVNGLLTQLDLIKTNPSIFLLATSNLLEILDQAFLDRIDLLVHVANPNEKAIYNIITASLRELMRLGMVKEEAIPEYESAVFEIGDDSLSIGILCITSTASANSCRKLKSLIFQSYVEASIYSAAQLSIEAGSILKCLSDKLH